MDVDADVGVDADVVNVDVAVDFDNDDVVSVASLRRPCRDDGAKVVNVKYSKSSYDGFFRFFFAAAAVRGAPDLGRVFSVPNGRQCRCRRRRLANGRCFCCLSICLIIRLLVYQCADYLGWSVWTCCLILSYLIRMLSYLFARSAKKFFIFALLRKSLCKPMLSTPIILCAESAEKLIHLTNQRLLLALCLLLGFPTCPTSKKMTARFPGNKNSPRSNV